MTDASDTSATDVASPGDEPSSDLEAYAASLVESLGALGSTVEFDTVRIHVANDKWVETINAASNDLELFSWLSAIDWSKKVEVGDPVDDVDALDERFEVLCRLSSVRNGDGAIFVTVLPKVDPTLASLEPTMPGAAWHEREAHEMFGIQFEGNPNLIPLYLPDDFIGNPLLKSYPLISREVKPFPGDVDVEPMPQADADADTADADTVEPATAEPDAASEDQAGDS
jgi:NADH-quinone oxidoreductase subunit C